MSNKKVKSTINKQAQETSFRKLSSKYAETAAVEDKRRGGSGKNNNQSQFSFKNEKKANMADSAQSTVRKENRVIKRPYESKQGEKGRRNKADEGKMPVGVKQYTRYKNTQNSSEEGSKASVQSNKRQKAMLLSIKKPKNLKSIDSVTQNQQKTQQKPLTKRKEAPKTNRLLFYKSEQTKSSPKSINPMQTKQFARQPQNHEQLASDNEFMVDQNSYSHQNVYEPQYVYKKNVHEKGEDKKLRLKNKLGFIIDMANMDEAPSVSYYSQSSLDSKNSQSERSRIINQPVKANKNLSQSVLRQNSQSIRQPNTRKMVFPQDKQQKSNNNKRLSDNQHETKKVNKAQNQTAKKKEANIRQDSRQKGSQQDIREQKIQRKHMVMHKKASTSYKKIKEEEKQQDRQEQQQKERYRHKDRQQREDSSKQKQEDKLKSKPKQQQKQKQIAKQRTQKLIQRQRKKQKQTQRQKQIRKQIQRQKQRHKQREREKYTQKDKQRERETQRQRQAQTGKQMLPQRQKQKHLQRKNEREKDKQRQRQQQKYKQGQRQKLKQIQKDKSNSRPQQMQKQQVKQRPKQQKYKSRPKTLQADIKEDDYNKVKNESENYFKNADSNSNFQIKLQKVLIDDPAPKSQPKRYVAQQKQDSKVSKRLNFDKQDTAQYQQSSRTANNANTDNESSKLAQGQEKQDDFLDQQIAELMKKNDEYLGLAKKQIQHNKFETDTAFPKDNQKEARTNQRKIIHFQPRRRIKTQLNQRQENNSRMLTDKQKTFLRLLKSKQEQLLNKIKSEIGNDQKPLFGDSYEFKPRHQRTQFERNDHKLDDGRQRKRNKINPTTKTYEVSKMLPVLSVASTKPNRQIESSYLAVSPYLMKRQKQPEYPTNLSRDQASKSMRNPNYSMKFNYNEPVIGRYNEKDYDSSDREYRTQNISEKYERLKRLMRRIQ